MNSRGEAAEGAGIRDRPLRSGVPLKLARTGWGPADQLLDLSARPQERRAQRRPQEAARTAQKYPVPRKAGWIHASSIHCQGEYDEGMFH
jgi:hypothetical protein